MNAVASMVDSITLVTLLLSFITESAEQLMKVKIKSWHAIAQWRWDTGNTDHDEGDGEGDVCGICRVPYEGCCPTCKVPGDDCPLSECTRVHLPFSLINGRAVWGECSHVFHMHCLLKWIGTPASKQQCPMDRRTWGTFSLVEQTTRITKPTLVTAERKVPQGQQGQ